MAELRNLARVGIALLVAAVAAVVGWVLFYREPSSTAELLGILLVVATVVVGLRVGGNIARSVFPGYNVAEVAVEGPITRDGGGGVPPSSPGTPGADDIVDLIETADDDSAEALLLRLNTPGGAVVPSDDIRLADLLDDEVETTELEPSRGVAERLRGGAERVAYAVGAGIASRFADADGEFRFRV